jgi:hypothetical protein
MNRLNPQKVVIFIISGFDPVFVFRALPTLQLTLIFKKVEDLPHFGNRQVHGHLFEITVEESSISSDLRLINRNLEILSIRSLEFEKM